MKFTTYSSIEKRLKDLRLLSGFSQTEFGIKLGVSHAAVSDYERAKTKISIETLQKWVEICGFDMSIDLVKSNPDSLEDKDK